MPGHPRGEWVCVRHTTNKHGADGEDLLGIGVGRDVTKTHAGQAAEGKVKGSDVGATYCRAPQCAVNVRCLETFAQLVEPPLEKKQQCEMKTCKLRFMSSTHMCFLPVLNAYNDRFYCNYVHVYVTQMICSTVVNLVPKIRYTSPGTNKPEC